MLKQSEIGLTDGKNFFSVFAALCAMAVMTLAADSVIESARYALKLCLELILPSLFPFFILSMLLSRLGFAALLSRLLSGAASRLFAVSGAGVSALFVGLTGGYPLGAVYIAELTERDDINLVEAERLLGFCNNSGPAFIIGAVGAGIFHSPAVGLLLYISHILSALLAGILLRQNAVARERPPHGALPQPFVTALSDAVRSAVAAVLNVCGFVVCFSVFASLLDVNGQLGLLCDFLCRLTGASSAQIRALLLGLLELGSGIGAMSGLPICPENLALASFIVGWGGVSVHFQTLSAIADLKIKSALHLAGRLISAFAGAAFSYALALLFFKS